MTWFYYEERVDTRKPIKKKYKNLPQIKQNKSNNGVARTALFEPSPHPFQREQQQQSTPPLQLLEDELSLPFYLTTSLLI